MAKIGSVLLVDGVGPECQKTLLKYGISVTNIAEITEKELIDEIPNYGALVVRSKTQVNAAVLDAGVNLRVVARAGTGLDNIDVAAAEARGIKVINAPGANTKSACELTCGLMMALARNVVPAAAALRAGRWERAAYVGEELCGLTLAVIGLGRVGLEVAARMRAFGMTIIGYDPILSEDQCEELNIVWMDLEHIWPHADYITLHTPLLDSTRNLINATVLEKCQKGVKIINVGRGGLINDKDLLAALKSGRVGAAALDVFEQEPPTDPVTLEIIQQPNVIATPHLGASTKDAQARVGYEIADQIVKLSLSLANKPKPLPEVTQKLE